MLHSVHLQQRGKIAENSMKSKDDNCDRKFLSATFEGGIELTPQVLLKGRRPNFRHLGKIFF